MRGREEAKENDVSYKVKLMEEGERGHCNTMHTQVFLKNMSVYVRSTYIMPTYKDCIAIHEIIIHIPSDYALGNSFVFLTQLASRHWYN